MSLFYSNPPGRRAGVFTFHMSSLMPWIDWIIYTLADFLTATFAAFPPTTFGRFCSSFLYEFWLFLWYLKGSTSGRNPAKKSVPLIDLTPRQAKYSNVCVIRCKKKFLIIQVFSAFCLTFAHACVQYCVSPLIYNLTNYFVYLLHTTQYTADTLCSRVSSNSYTADTLWILNLQIYLYRRFVLHSRVI